MAAAGAACQAAATTARRHRLMVGWPTGSERRRGALNAGAWRRGGRPRHALPAAAALRLWKRGGAATTPARGGGHARRTHTAAPSHGGAQLRVSILSSQHEKSVVSCSVRVSGNTTYRIETRAEHILPATKDHAVKAINAINGGQVIAVPTDTIYGFACDACSAEAVNRIYEIKGRTQTRPLAICVADVPDLSRFAVVDHLPHGLLDSLLPGPVTVVLKRGENSILERSLNPGLDSIGVRIPNFDFIRTIARGARSALALTSANFSGRPSSVSVKDFEDLWPHCSYAFDGGILSSGRAGSTIVDLITPGVYKILRDGSSRDETTAVLAKFGFVEAS